MAYGMVENQLKWKKQLHERFDFDRTKQCSGSKSSPDTTSWQFQQMHALPGDVSEQEKLKIYF